MNAKTLVVSLAAIISFSAHADGLNQLRKDIEEIDRDIVKLLAKRTEVVKEIGEYKSAHGLPMRDVTRENAVLERVGQLAEDKYHTDVNLVKNVYRTIMSESVRLEVERSHQERLLQRIQ